MSIKRVLIAMAVTLSVSCLHSEQGPGSPLALPPDIKSLAVRRIENKVGADSLEKMWLAIVANLVKDGRVPYQSDEDDADGIVVSTLKYYRKTPLSQGSNRVDTEFQLSAIMDVELVDRKSGKTLWDEPNLQRKLRYSAETEPGGETEEAARERLWVQLASDIVKRTLYGAGAASSVNPRSVPKMPGDH